MLKQVVSVILAVTQVASWSALPLYLCVGKDGSVGIDLGYESCTCCSESEEHDVHSQSTCACSGGRHDHDAVGGCAGSFPEVSDACGCLHYQIVHQQGPIVARGNARGGNVAQADRPTAPACGLPRRDEVAALVSICCRPISLTTAGDRLMPRAPIVLRC